MNYEKLTDAQIKKLLSIERRMKKCNDEILKMGFDVYLANDTCNIMSGPSHDENQDPLKENVLHSFTLRKWSGGDW